MAANTNQQSSPTDVEIRVTATYRRNEQIALTRSQLFAATTELHVILQWAQEAEEMSITLSRLEIEVAD